MWPFISYLSRAQPPPLSCYYGVSFQREETVQPRAHVSPTSGTFSSNEGSLQSNIHLYKEVYKIYSLLGMKVMIFPVVM